MLDLALAAAGRALDRGRALLRAAAGAGVADIKAGELDIALDALVDFFERELDFGLEVVAAGDAAATTTAAEATLSPTTEDVVEHREDVLDVHAAEVVGGRALGLTQAVVAVLVVELALLGIGEDLVRRGGFLELRLGLGVAWVAIGVVLHRQAAVGALDLLRVGGFGDAQHFVIVTCRWHEKALGTGH